MRHNSRRVRWESLVCTRVMVDVVYMPVRISHLKPAFFYGIFSFVLLCPFPIATGFRCCARLCVGWPCMKEGGVKKEFPFILHHLHSFSGQANYCSHKHRQLTYQIVPGPREIGTIGWVNPPSQIKTASSYSFLTGSLLFL